MIGLRKVVKALPQLVFRLVGILDGCLRHRTHDRPSTHHLPPADGSYPTGGNGGATMGSVVDRLSSAGSLADD